MPTVTNPAFSTPTNASCTVGPSGMITATRSPRSTPVATRARAIVVELSSYSRHVVSVASAAPAAPAGAAMNATASDLDEVCRPIRSASDAVSHQPFAR